MPLQSNTTNQETPIRLSISEAAKLFGVSMVTLRRAIKLGELPYVVVRGRYQLSFDTVLKWSQASQRTQKKLVQAGVGQYVSQWKISNPLFSPNPKKIQKRSTGEVPHNT